MDHLRRSWESEFGFQSLQSVPLFDLGKGGNSDFPRRGLVFSAKLTKCVCSVSLSLLCITQKKAACAMVWGAPPVNDQHRPRAPTLCLEARCLWGGNSARGPPSPGPAGPWGGLLLCWALEPSISSVPGLQALSSLSLPL